MLQTLSISNYALIDRVEIDFTAGFNVITGETGAGKSIMLGALSLLLGGRADTRTVADPSRKSVIEADFLLESDYPGLRALCVENDIDWDGKHCLLRREISAAGGRSRAFVNDSPVALSRLRDVALHLIDIHSQHQNQLLAQPSFQLDVIDALAGNAGRLEEYRRRYEAFKAAVKRLKVTQKKLELSRENEEYTRYQLARIDELNLSPGEQQELERQREVATNISSLKSGLRRVIAALSDDNDEGVISRLHEAEAASASIVSLLGEEVTSRLESARIEIEDILSTFTDADEDLQSDPRLLEEIEQRLSAIYDLQRRHKVETVEELIAIAESLRSRLTVIDNGDEEVSHLRAEARRLRALALEQAAQLSEARHEAASQLRDELLRVARPLGMKNLDVDIRVSPADISSTGTDHVDFLFSFNKNQPLTTVAGVASGGEISRLMLSVKTIIASHMRLPSIIFDEIDTGVSGEVAGRMGAMMRQMASDIQVIAITHLPTVAAKGASHFKVYKYDDETSTHTAIRRLSDDERIDELAMMLSGDSAGSEARAAAASLMKE